MTEYYKTVAIKLFLDGVVEAHTGWMEEEYADAPGYYGDKRFTDLDKYVTIVKTANEMVYLYMFTVLVMVQLNLEWMDFQKHNLKQEYLI